MTAKTIAFALGDERLTLALQSLAIRLEENQADTIEMVVCGFIFVLKRLLRSIGYDTVAERL